MHGQQIVPQPIDASKIERDRDKDGEIPILKK